MKLSNLFIISFIFALNLLAQEDKFSLTCNETQEVAEKCFQVKGVFGVYNGTPTYRISTRNPSHIFGVYDLNGTNNEYPGLPPNLAYLIKTRSLLISEEFVCGDFDVCPTKKRRKGSMQSVCIHHAKNLKVVKKLFTCFGN